MVRRNDFQLITLGRLALVSPSDEDASVELRRRKLVLLVVLALAERPYTRESLADMFWGEEEEERARHSLSDALSHFRRVLGRSAIAHRKNDITLSEDVRLGVDALEFAAACDTRDSASAVKLYGGPFLDGVFVDRSPRFEEWVSRKRDQFARMFIGACESECMSLARSRRWDDCAALARRWLSESPLSTDAALYLINAIKAPGTRDAALSALAEYEALSDRLEREYDLQPDQRVSALAAELAARVAARQGGISAVGDGAPGPSPPRASGGAGATDASASGSSATGVGATVFGATGASGTGVGASDVDASNVSATDAHVSDRVASDRVASDRVASEGAASERAAPERVASDRVASARGASESSRAGSVDHPAESDSDPHASRSQERLSEARRRTLLAIGAAALSLLLITAGTFLAGRRAANASLPAASGRPVVAITMIQNVRGDPTVTWLQEGFKQMIAADLSRSGAVEVVAPSRVRDVAERAQLDGHGKLTTDDALRLAREVGATWVVSGGVTRGEDLYVLDVGLRDVATGKLIRLFTVTGTDILEVADQAASHILAAASAGGPGPRLADVETSDVEAYQHYVRAVQARGEGRFADELRELDAAIAVDSGFVSALTARLRLAQDARDGVLVARLAEAFRHASSRATDWDRLYEGVYSALHNGEHARAEALGRELTERYPHDPRGYAMLADVYALHGRWEAADTVLQRALSLDSLATEAGRGPCAPCTAFDGVVRMRLATGELSGAERAARRWVALQPEAPAPWGDLSEVLACAGRYDSALVAARRAAMLSGDDPAYAVWVGRILLMERHFDEADSAISSLLGRDGEAYKVAALDLKAMLLRERGQMRESNKAVERAVGRYPSSYSLDLVRGSSLALLGEWREAVRVYESRAHALPWPEPPSPYNPLSGDYARTFAWEHALAADALAASGDTARLLVLADSIEIVGARSYYGRDWRLHHHVRGLVAMRGGRFREAIREFEMARWGSAGWTVTVARIARARLALGEARNAIAVLRDAYEAPPDGMGRYEPRSELDLLMAAAFRQAGMSDSSKVYASYVRRAWANADPEVKTRLLRFDRGQSPGQYGELAGVVR